MLVDTSVWVDHFRRSDPRLTALLSRGEVECHPFIIGELALGELALGGLRREVLSLLQKLPAVSVASHDEVLAFVTGHSLTGRGIGWIDAHLLASAALDRRPLWTRDRRLSEIARALKL